MASELEQQPALESRDPLWFRSVFCQHFIGVVEILPSGEFGMVNPRICELLQLDREDLLHLHWSDIAHPEHCQADEEEFSRVRSGECEDTRLLTRWRRADGETVWVEVILGLVRASDGEPCSWLALVSDVTHYEWLARRSDRRLTLNKSLSLEGSELLQRMATELTKAEQRTRRRVARNLHDHLQQVLVGIRLKLAAVTHGCSESELARELLEIGDLVNDSLELTRSLTMELNPHLSGPHALCGALEKMAESKLKHHGLRVELSVDPRAEPADETVRMALYEATRELLLNVVKHAGVSSARVRMLPEKHGSCLIVEDDGNGFDLSLLETAEKRGTGFGLLDIRQRLELLGGTVEFKSLVGHGTQVVLTVPSGVPETGAE